jgi:predicted dithiol-disulfide oxidoreductase (DUF899 family)
MSLPDVASREEWLEARRRLLAQEKEFTRGRDALNASRRRLPMVRVDKEYVFEGPDGAVTLAGLFGGGRQLIIQHVMLGPDWDQPCPGCSASIDEIAPGVLDHLASRETVFVLASRARYDKIAGWPRSAAATRRSPADVPARHSTRQRNGVLNTPVRFLKYPPQVYRILPRGFPGN